jgi:acetolactate synthase-1/2/3 large subunit
VLVDIDLTELRKLPAFGKVIDHAIHADARKFIDQLLIQVQGVNLPSITTWLEKITSWRMRYPSPRGPSDASASVNPYRFMDLLSAALEPGDLVISDTGCAIAWATQSFHLKTGQRLVHAFNNTPMGYALPGAIGAAFAARDLKRIICLAGDGSLMMNMQELATVRHHDLPIKLFVMNNDGYAMVQQTQEQWLGARYFATATGPDGGLSFPNFGQLAGAFSIASNTIRTTGEIETAIGEALSTPGPFLCDVHIPSTARVEPQSRFGFPLEDSEPLLPRAEFLDNMIVPALDVSLKAKV